MMACAVRIEIINSFLVLLDSAGKNMLFLNAGRHARSALL